MSLLCIFLGCRCRTNSTVLSTILKGIYYNDSQALYLIIRKCIRYYYFMIYIFFKQPKAGLPKSDKVPILTVAPIMANIQAERIPKRKNPMKAGTKGRPISVLTNMMALNVKNLNPDVVHYDVDISPNLPKYLMRPVFLEARKKLFPKRNPAFDGKKNAFSCGELPIKDPVKNLNYLI